mmetsp:Transcript_87473/g.168448  ORF Transcript_87473/g.168448 Transcript_87473/m.168448 type:complete len:88 (-) Transcript_87473:63-326(-)
MRPTPAVEADASCCRPLVHALGGSSGCCLLQAQPTLLDPAGCDCRHCQAGARPRHATKKRQLSNKCGVFLANRDAPNIRQCGVHPQP